MVVAGIDIGSLTTKTVIIDKDKRILGQSLILTGASSEKAVQVSMDEALKAASLAASDLDYIVSTGYGRGNVPLANSQVTEITCHAYGMHFLFPEVRTVIDIGGQDSKVIALGDKGQVIDFTMNDKCAAGSGRFLEVMSRALEVTLEEMGELSLKAKKVAEVSSMCTVFAESEVISLISARWDKNDIIAGIHQSIARRMVSMVGRVGLRERAAMSGGVARNIGVVMALENTLKISLIIPDEPQLVGALGAALIAANRLLTSTPG